MKKLMIIVAVLLLASFAVEKELTVKAPLPVWEYHFAGLRNIQILANQSDMPNQKVKYIIKTIDSLLNFIVPQLRSQLEVKKEENKKP